MATPAHAGPRRLVLPPLASAAILGIAVSWNLANVGASADTLAAHFGVGLPAIGVLASALFIAQVLVQVPVGRVIDRIGCRPGAIVCLVLCILANGVILLDVAYGTAVALRFLAGIAMASGFIAGSTWARAGTPTPMAQGIFGASAIAGAGIAIATVPMLGGVMGWRAPFASAALVAALGLAVLLPFSVAPAGITAARPKLRSVITDPRVLRFAAINVATFGTSIVLGNWIVPFLLRHGTYSPASAGVVGGLSLIGVMLGRALGGLAVRTPERGRTVVVASMVSGAAATVVLAMLAAVPAVAVPAVLVAGIAAGLPFGTIFESAARARPDAPASAIAIVSAPAVAAIVVGTPLVGFTFAGPGNGRLGILAVGAVWAAALFLVPSGAAFAGDGGRAAPGAGGAGSIVAGNRDAGGTQSRRRT